MSEGCSRGEVDLPCSEWDAGLSGGRRIRRPALTDSPTRLASAPTGSTGGSNASTASFSPDLRERDGDDRSLSSFSAGEAPSLSRHNTVFSNDIVNGQVKLADTNVGLRLHCPTGTRYHEGACIEKVARPPMTWTPAANDCKDEGRRLPTVAELSTFRLEPGIALGGPVEWTLELDQDSSMAFAVGESGNLVSALPPPRLSTDARRGRSSDLLKPPGCGSRRCRRRTSRAPDWTSSRIGSALPT